MAIKKPFNPFDRIEGEVDLWELTAEEEKALTEGGFEP